MRFIDLVILILDNLGRRKARVALTAVGVVIGSAAVVILVSLAIGLQRNATSQLYGIGDLSLVRVYPNYGDMPTGPGGPVMVEGPGGKPGVPPNQKMLTTRALEEIGAVPGVVQVIARDYLQMGGTISINRLETYAGITGVSVKDLTLMGAKPKSGTMVLEKGTAVVGAMIAQNFYDPRPRPGGEPPQPPELQDANVKLTLSKWVDDGKGGGYEQRRSFPIRIVGVIQERSEHDYSIYMTMEEVTAFNEWGRGKRINRNEEGYMEAIVKVEDPKDATAVADAITTLGYQANTPQDYLEGINSFYLIMQITFGGVGAIALLVAAIGIANTMAMAILERTREIGLMKAVGATNRDVLSVFLGEAAGIGFIGGLGGILVGWSLGQIINVLAMAYMAGQSAQQGGPPPSIAVYTPPWLLPSTLIFATLIGLFSGLYPALRAATLIPVNALKYE